MGEAETVIRLRKPGSPVIALLAVGAVLVLAGGILLLSTVRTAGLDCGTALSPRDFTKALDDADGEDVSDSIGNTYSESFSGRENEDFVEGANVAALTPRVQACEAKTSDRSTMGWIALAPGAVLVLAGLIAWPRAPGGLPPNQPR